MEGTAEYGRAHDEIHQREGGDVENRADRPDSEHETSDGRRLPAAGSGQKRLVHIVPGQCDIDGVVYQVQQDDLDGGHRQKRQKETGRQYGKHVAEIGTGRHFDVFDHVAVDFAAFDHTLFQNHQVFFQQHDIRRFFRDIDGCIDGNGRHRRFHGRSVVDAVAHIADDMAVSAQG